MSDYEQCCSFKMIVSKSKFDTLYNILAIFVYVCNKGYSQVPKFPIHKRATKYMRRLDKIAIKAFSPEMSRLYHSCLQLKSPMNPTMANVRFSDTSKMATIEIGILDLRISELHGMKNFI